MFCALDVSHFNNTWPQDTLSCDILFCCYGEQFDGINKLLRGHTEMKMYSQKKFKKFKGIQANKLLVSENLSLCKPTIEESRYFNVLGYWFIRSNWYGVLNLHRSREPASLTRYSQSWINHTLLNTVTSAFGNRNFFDLNLLNSLQFVVIFLFCISSVYNTNVKPTC